MAVSKLENRRLLSVCRAGMCVSAHPAPSKRPVRSCVNWGTGRYYHPVRLEMLVKQVLRYKRFDTLNLRGCLTTAKVFVRARQFCAVCLTRWKSLNCACLPVPCAKGCCMRWKAVSAIRTSASVPRKARWNTITWITPGTACPHHHEKPVPSVGGAESVPG